MKDENCKPYRNPLPVTRSSSLKKCKIFLLNLSIWLSELTSGTHLLTLIILLLLDDPVRTGSHMWSPADHLHLPAQYVRVYQDSFCQWSCIYTRIFCQSCGLRRKGRAGFILECNFVVVYTQSSSWEGNTSTTLRKWPWLWWSKGQKWH